MMEGDRSCFSLFSVKIRFMLETMLALKNNDMRKIPGYDPEPVERLRKLQRTLVSDLYSGPSPAFVSRGCPEKTQAQCGLGQGQSCV